MSVEGCMNARQALLMFALLTMVAPVRAHDVFRTDKQVPASPAGGLLIDRICPFEMPIQPLLLQEALDRALCHNPKTRQAWMRIRVDAANVGVARSAYLPTMTATWQGMRSQSSTTVSQQPQLDSKLHANSQTQSLSLNWLLYDFGGRSASLSAAKALFLASQANYESALQASIIELMQSYYATQYAEGALAIAREAEDLAGNSQRVSEKRMQRGVASISDVLQAQAAEMQARVTRVNAERELQVALGKLAVCMGLPPNTPVNLPSIDTGSMPSKDIQRAVSDMMDEAARRHPDVRAAQSRWRAAEAKVEQVRAQGKPTLSLLAKVSRNTQPVRAYLGQPEFEAAASDNQIALQITVPLFEGFERTYQVRQAEAQAALQGEVLIEAQQNARLDIWESYQALLAAMQNLQSHDSVLNIAHRLMVATDSRYKLGVGSMLELLNMQSSLAAAKRQRLQALMEWRTSRARLAATFGRLEVGEMY